MLVVVVAILWSLGQSQTFPYVSFMNQTLANHSYVDLRLVGRDHSDSVQCHTDLDTCCNSTQGPHRGDWYFPNGTRLPFPGGNNVIIESREAQRVDLRHKSDSIIPTGIYRCDIQTSAVHQTFNNTVKNTICGTLPRRKRLMKPFMMHLILQLYYFRRYHSNEYDTIH